MKVNEDITRMSQAHTNLNIFATIEAILEGGVVYPVGTANTTAQKIIRLCSAERGKQLRLYDKLSERQR